jgi:predicted amidohydrolase
MIQIEPSRRAKKKCSMKCWVPHMKRRSFLNNSAIALGAFSSRLASAAPTRRAPFAARPVRVASIGFRPGMSLETIAALVDTEGARGADIIALPETCRGLNAHSGEDLDGPTVSAMAQLARKHKTYVVCPIDRRTGGRRFNSAVLLDRAGQVATVYDKIYPVWQAECLLEPAVHPGEAVRVYTTDFGRVGLAICFDVNWAPLWQHLSDQGAELVIWPSAYSAGRSLESRAIDYNYYIVSSTWVPDCLVYDIDGELLLHDHANQGKDTNVTRVVLDLDRCIFHQDLNRGQKLDKLLSERGDDVEQEKWLPMEGWFVLRAKRRGVSAREIARQYGLEELRPYINRSRREIDKCRGREFS